MDINITGSLLATSASMDLKSDIYYFFLFLTTSFSAPPFPFCKILCHHAAVKTIWPVLPNLPPCPFSIRFSQQQPPLGLGSMPVIQWIKQRTAEQRTGALTKCLPPKNRQFRNAGNLLFIQSYNNNIMNSDENWQEFDCLHPKLLAALTKNQLAKPTRIQSEVFSNYSHYHDFLIAAQTGSGKTLAFAAPILSELQFLRDTIGLANLPHCILGLVLTPTRQLAQQIHANMLMALQLINLGHQPQNQIKITCIIGGMSKEKQLRVLNQRKPQIIIGTPGRLHELLDDQIINFSNLKYLVVDEADRMIEMGHFKEIDEILEKIFVPKKEEFFDQDFEEINKELTRKAHEELNEFYIKENGKKVKLSFNINTLATEQLFEVPQGMFQISGFANPEEVKAPVKPGKAKKQKKVKDSTKMQAEMNSKQLQFLSKLKRRIFFISATLTREFKGTKYFIKKARTQDQWKQKKQERKLKRKQKEKQMFNKDGKKEENDKDKKEDLEESIPKLKALLSRAQFSDKPKVIDQSSLLFLPQKLVERACFTDGDLQRMTMMVCYLSELPVNSKTIVFSNTIKACRRIQFFVQSFGFQTVNLHSHMQQKQRLKRLQKFKKSTLCNILIATDVAARGLDFNISHVIQVGVPVNGDTYVHRAGRTARANREGEAFILIDKKEINRWTEINDIIAETTANRKVQKFTPAEMLVDQTRDKVEKLEWIRRNEERFESKKAKMLDQEDAENVGVEIEEEAPRRKYNMDKEDEERVRYQVKKKVQIIRNDHKKTVQQNDSQKWRKNKLVLTAEELKKLI